MFLLKYLRTNSALRKEIVALRQKLALAQLRANSVIATKLVIPQIKTHG